MFANEPRVEDGTTMQDGSTPNDHLTSLEIEHLRVTRLLHTLEVVIGDLEGAPHLRKDEAARLDRYRQNFARLQDEKATLWSEIELLLSSLDTEVRVPVMLNDEMLKQVQEEEASEAQLRSCDLRGSCSPVSPTQRLGSSIPRPGPELLGDRARSLPSASSAISG